jgi:hypothetical protein
MGAFRALSGAVARARKRLGALPGKGTAIMRNQVEQPDLFGGHCGGSIRSPTAAEIEAAKTPRGGWTRKQLAQWGVAWPPRRGWKRRLIAQSGGLNRYPDCPGYKTERSRESAEKIAGHARTVRRRTLHELVHSHPAGFTADELARRLGEPILTVRPRVSELHAAGLIEPSPERRTNESGHSATVWLASHEGFGR